MNNPISHRSKLVLKKLACAVIPAGIGVGAMLGIGSIVDTPVLGNSIAYLNSVKEVVLSIGGGASVSATLFLFRGH